MIEHNEKNMVGTTIIMVRKGDSVVIAGDGQVSLGQTIIKNNACLLYTSDAADE